MSDPQDPPPDDLKDKVMENEEIKAELERRKKNADK